MAVETAAAVGFDGTSEELECLLVSGLEAPELSEADFWEAVDRETNLMIAKYHDNSGA